MNETTFVTTDDSVKLHVERCGEGTAIVFVHEFAGDARSWEPQMRYLSRRYHCIAHNARGYPPSDIPEGVTQYSQARAAADIRSVLDGFGIDRAHVVGLSMGGFATLQFGLSYPERAHSLVVAGVGYGAEREKREQFRQEADATARDLRQNGMAAFARRYAMGPARVQFQNKDPRGWAEFLAALEQHSAEGSALTQLGVQRERPSVFDLEAEMAALEVPTLIVTGDEDWPCHLPNIFMKRTIRSADLLVVPGTGHTVNLEEPAFFNAAIERFFAQVDAGRWRNRDPRAISNTITGIK